MKLVRIFTAMPEYLKYFYARHPNVKGKSYEEQKEQLDYDAFRWTDCWKESLEPRGYKVTELLTNAKPLQTAWAKENGLRRYDRWWLDIA